MQSCAQPLRPWTLCLVMFVWWWLFGDGCLCAAVVTVPGGAVESKRSVAISNVLTCIVVTAAAAGKRCRLNNAIACSQTRLESRVLVAVW